MHDAVATKKRPVAITVIGLLATGGDLLKSLIVYHVVIHWFSVMQQEQDNGPGVGYMFSQ